MATEEDVPFFAKGESVLCYEPDKEKARVLYEAKILGDNTPHEKGKKKTEYRVHFIGWGRKWDRRVKADTLLKDNEENRKLMNELASAAKLEKSNNHLYKVSAASTNTPKRRQDKKSVGGSAAVESESAEPKGPARLSETSMGGGRSDRRSGDGPRRNRGGGEKPGPFSKIRFNKDNDHQHHFEQGKRIKLCHSARLRRYLEFDNLMVVKRGVQHIIPARKSIVEILEDFVKQRAVELVMQSTVEINISSRQRSTAQHTEKMGRENDRVMSTVNLLKEVADGVRIYFIFLLNECLLYKQESAYMQQFLSPEYLSTVQRKPSVTAVAKASKESEAKSAADGDAKDTKKVEKKVQTDITNLLMYGSPGYKEQLHRHLSAIQGKSRSNASLFSAAVAMPRAMHRNLDDVFNWQMLPDEVPPEASMIFGATHLARLLVKLPDQLSASPMSDEKLKVLIKHLDALMNYVESHEEWFTQSNYVGYDEEKPATSKAAAAAAASKAAAAAATSKAAAAAAASKAAAAAATAKAAAAAAAATAPTAAAEEAEADADAEAEDSQELPDADKIDAALSAEIQTTN